MGSWCIEIGEFEKKLEDLHIENLKTWLKKFMHELERFKKLVFKNLWYDLWLLY